MRNYVQGRWVQVLHNGETLRPPISFGGDDIATRSCSDSCSVPTGPCRVILMHRNYVQGRWAQVLHNGVPQGTLLPVLEVTSTHGGVAVTPAATPAAASQRSFAAPAAAAPPPAVPAEPAVDRPATLSFAAPAAAATPPGVPPSTFRRSPPGTSRPNTAEPKLLAFWLPFLRSNSQATCAVGLTVTPKIKEWRSQPSRSPCPGTLRLGSRRGPRSH